MTCCSEDCEIWLDFKYDPCIIQSRETFDYFFKNGHRPEKFPNNALFKYVNIRKFKRLWDQISFNSNTIKCYSQNMDWLNYMDMYLLVRWLAPFIDMGDVKIVTIGSFNPAIEFGYGPLHDFKVIKHKNGRQEGYIEEYTRGDYGYDLNWWRNALKQNDKKFVWELRT